MSDIKNRVLAFIKHKKLNNKQFEDICGLGNGFVSKIGDSIRIQKIDLISNAFLDLNRDWLLRGVGEMLINIPQIPNTYVNGMSANYQGHFSQPIHTEIGNTNQSRKEGKYLEIERELFRLREENARLLIQLEYKDKLIEEKDKVIEEKGRFIEMILTKSLQ